jgi:hypothetical protein
MANDLDDLDEAEGGPQPAKGRELVIVDLGHATMMGQVWLLLAFQLLSFVLAVAVWLAGPRDR